MHRHFARYYFIISFLFILSTFSLIQSFAQTPINGNAWNGNSGSASPAGFTSFPATIAPGAAASLFSTWQRNGPLGDGTGGSFNSNNWTVGGSLATAMAANTFVSFTVTNNSTTEVRITSFSISSQISSTGPQQVAMMYSINGGANILFGAPYGTHHNASPETFPFSGSACIGAGQVATFKLYGWAATGGTGTLRINNGTTVIATYATVISGPSPSASSNSPICTGSPLNFTGTASGGLAPDTYSWSGPATFSSTQQNPTIASPTVASAGVYTLTVTDAMTCTATATTSVNITTAAGPITGPDSVCAGSAITLSDAGGGSWSSNNPSVATVGTGSGVVTGVSADTTTIFYAIGGSCFASVVVTVNPIPVAITGIMSMCAGATTALTSSGAGLWSISNTSVATVGSSTGVVSGISAGTANITYQAIAGGCFTVATVTVNPMPSPIVGTLAVCQGATATLTDAVTGGTWTSSNTTVATIGSSGVVYGLMPGTSTVSYALQGNCLVTVVITVNSIPGPITGAGMVCVASTMLLTDGGTGVWTSSNTSIATVVSGSGTVTGVAAGTAVISFTNSNGCSATTIITVNPLPGPIVGATNVCAGATTTLSDLGIGTWSSSNTTIATVLSTTGDIYGIAAGTTGITYTLPTGCKANTVVTVFPLPTAISGTLNVCAGLTTNLADAGGGTWTSSNTSIATVVLNTGAVTGAASGTTTITYTLSTGCNTTAIITVNPLPGNILGFTSVCVGATISLTDLGTGTWSSGNTTVATVVPATGIVSGASAGTALITYTLPTGCFTTQSITVFGLPAAITGVTHVCAGQTVTLTDGSGGGTWSSSNTTIATVGTGGVVTGVATGTATITYTISTGCYVTTNFTVNPVPGLILGQSNVCVGAVITLSDIGAGTWTSGNTSVATVTSGTGDVTGVAPGTSLITYTLSSGCSISEPITVFGLPAPISGTTHICIGQSTVLTDGNPGGSWISSNTAVATVGTAYASSVSSVSAGTTIITYTLGTGCYSTTIVTVNPLPAAISGPSAVCSGSSITLTDGGGGSWTSSNTSVATVVSGMGVVNGTLPGTSVISYILSTGCIATEVITVNPLPAAISGTTSSCVGAVVLLSDAGSGTWSSGNSMVASIDVAGAVTGLAAGTAVITYTLPTGCIATQPVTVNPLPAAITGNVLLCPATTTLLSNTGAGSWSSGNTAVATITSGGVVYGVAPGTSVISFTSPFGCVVTTVVGVNTPPDPIAGSTALCIGSAGSLIDAGGGMWTSSNTAVATVSQTTGMVRGLAAGTSTIVYTLSSGCQTSAVITVNAFPANIAGPAVVCIGTSATLVDGGGGTWMSSNSSIATINSATGIVTGLNTGSVTITYTLGTGCITTSILSVDPLPAPISGALNVCVGATTTLNDAGGGTWSSANTSVATVVTSNGIVTGVMADTVSIRYTTPAGCVISAIVTVNPLPAAITGNGNICLGSTTTLSDGGGGTWSSSNTARATVFTGSGVVTGVTLGTATITYKLSTGCAISTIVTVNPLPNSIAGTLFACEGSASTLANAVGGTWSSSNTGVATVDLNVGMVNGVSAGTSVITYMNTLGCTTTAIFTVNPLPAAISGATSACIGSVTNLFDACGTGTWSIANTAIATVVTATGSVTGVTAGSTTVTFTLPTGCKITAPVTIISLPNPITGVTHACAGSATTLIDAGGGIWASTNTTVATVGTTGVVSGIVAGTTTISYTLGTGCAVTTTVTINALPSAISGALSVCSGFGLTLSDGTPGGTWASSNTAVATFNAGSAFITGLVPGTSTITYILGTGCSITAIFTVNPLPSAISGLPVVCVGSVTTLSDAGGGTWSSSPTSIATVVAGSGVVAGVSAGTALITYRLTTGCITTKIVTVNPAPSIITGPSNICFGFSGIMADASSGGTWSSNNTAVAVINTGGLVTGVSPGTSIISYANPTGCVITKTITINALPSVISGDTTVCIGAQTDFTDSGGGTWSSGNIAVAIVGLSNGIVSGISLGSALITYTSPAGCSATKGVTVLPAPSAIMGADNTCTNTTITLADTTVGGVWSSGNTLLATIGSSSGIVYGSSSGTVIISYTSGTTGCSAVKSVIVNPVSPILGDSIVCAGQSVTLTDTTAVGLWGSSTTNATIVTTSITTARVTGVTAGTTIISYTLPTGCIASKELTVNLVPLPITGADQVCTGLTTTLHDAVTGGVWTSSDTNVAPIDHATGLVTGESAGHASIMYSRLGCSVVKTFTVNPLPAAITGITEICAGNNILLADSTLSGVWSSSNTAIASIGPATGLFTGIAAGTASITYTLPTGCLITTSVVVDPLPSSIIGITNVCVGFTTILSDAGGGSWSNDNGSVATIDAMGTLSGISAGVITVTYTLPTGCYTTTQVTVNALPPAITGPSQVCVGAMINLSDAETGGSWSSSVTAIAHIGSSTGIISGIAPGTSMITYTLGTSCAISKVITVNPLPSSISGIKFVCSGNAANLFDATTGGTWSSNNTNIATVDSFAGSYTGVAAGTATITYATSCAVTTTVTVIPTPGPILGITRICQGATETLTDAVTGGTWISSNTAIATINSATGAITGIVPGTLAVIYTTGGHCPVSTSVTILELPHLHNLVGGGSYCAGGAGVHIGLDGSDLGINYLLYLGATPTGVFAGTNAALDFGLQTVAGDYSVVAVNTSTGCTNQMAGTAPVIITPTVVPGVSIAAYPGDTVCSGTSTTFIPTPVNGGTAPTYTWQVNGIAVSNANTYTYIPADGDVITAIVTSNITCPFPPTGSGSLTMSVLDPHTPSVTVIADPGDTVCKGSPIHLTAVPLYGGNAPAYNWVVNGGGSYAGDVYTYIPENGDQVHVALTSNYLCRLANTAVSDDITVYTDTPTIPLVTINADPGTSVQVGGFVTLTASVVNGGASPGYQWTLNNRPVFGATTNTYFSNNFNTEQEDSVTCIVTSSGACAATSFQWVYINVRPLGVSNVTTGGSTISIIPNPSVGEFTIKGRLGTNTNDEVAVTITDMLGQVVYKDKLKANNGEVNKHITVGSEIANGMYLLNLVSGEENRVFHIVVEQ